MMLLINYPLIVRSLSPSRSEGGLLSWFGIGGAADAAAARQLTPEQERLVKVRITIIGKGVS